jgi:hypothetical protein
MVLWGRVECIEYQRRRPRKIYTAYSSKCYCNPQVYKAFHVARLVQL